MKYTVKVAQTTYEVEIDNIHARPVIVRVNGQSFEVMPEPNSGPVVSRETPPSHPAGHSAPPVAIDAGMNDLTAPLPGTVIEVCVKAGDQVEVGQVVLIIEAMKMKNSIRSTRAGTIQEVLVSTGQTVAHKQPLVRFS